MANDTRPQVHQWVQVDASTHYDPITYLNPKRMAAVGYQFRLLHQYFPEAVVLEVGVGAGLTTQILRQLGHHVETIDVDEKLQPDIVGSITDLPVEDQAYNAFLCCQVLEHLPWDDLDTALHELARVVSEGGVISVPSNKPTWLLLKHDSKSSGTRRITLGSRRNKPMKVTDGQHYWELESNRTTEDFRKKVRAAGLLIEEELQPVEYMYHQFFVVRKEKA